MALVLFLFERLLRCIYKATLPIPPKRPYLTTDLS